uniref:Uncharacterized protein n=1 Tax=Arundo donax TaxID=35708 RepID=A0A0A9BS16_ARUDO
MSLTSVAILWRILACPNKPALLSMNFLMPCSPAGSLPLTRTMNVSILSSMS